MSLNATAASNATKARNRVAQCLRARAGTCVRVYLPRLAAPLGARGRRGQQCACCFEGIRASHLTGPLPAHLRPATRNSPATCLETPPHPAPPPHARTHAPQALLLSAKFDATNAGALKRSSTPWSKVPPNSRLVFASKGRGEVSVAASLNFVPAEVMAFPTYRGLWVQRVVQLRQGGSVVAAPLAAQVTIAIQVGRAGDGRGARP